MFLLLDLHEAFDKTDLKAAQAKTTYLNVHIDEVVEATKRVEEEITWVLESELRIIYKI